VVDTRIWGCERAYARSHPQIRPPFTPPKRGGAYGGKSWRTKEDDEKIIRLDYCSEGPFAGKLIAINIIKF